MADTTKSIKSMRSEMARVRGLGSAKEGAQHWWMQRLTAVALIPLGIWLVASLVGLAGADRAAIALWLSSPFTLGALPLLLLATLYHAVLGLQVVIEDYVHTEATKIASIILMKLAAFALGAIAVVSLLIVAFRG
ncbi:MAG TPA: succinate dehydrogenase, hydrophobic membrane anchor protein [Dongiaceae bacterium]|jgi:succinate dehydrogenase / fumarate reductase membrane anchor subunit